jgi:hypothetical protein
VCSGFALVTADSVSATAWVGTAAWLDGEDASAAGAAAAGRPVGSDMVWRVATYAPPAAAVRQPSARTTNANGFENMAEYSLCNRGEQGPYPEKPRIF